MYCCALCTCLLQDAVKISIVPRPCGGGGKVLFFHPPHTARYEANPKMLRNIIHIHDNIIMVSMTT